MTRRDDRERAPGARAEALLRLADATAALFHRLHRVSEQLHGGGTLSAGRRALLLDLAVHGPQTVAHMARKRPVARQYIQTLVNELERDSLVERVPNPAHKRSPLVRLTRKGRRRVRAIGAREARLLRAGRLSISDRELRAARETLCKVTEFFESHAWLQKLGTTGAYTSREEEQED
jgi:DNA-binding MarR family transcriptional regulator